MNNFDILINEKECNKINEIQNKIKIIKNLLNEIDDILLDDKKINKPIKKVIKLNL